ncbi:MAG: hypothetical protein LBQ57_00270, partial [Spirochaetales bacterium]|nr:hypothetical protein [Spirochaetales bacterium]
SPQKTGLFGGSAAVAAASRPFNPIAPRGLKKMVSFWNWLYYSIKQNPLASQRQGHCPDQA